MIKKFNVEKTRRLNKINRLLSVFYRKPSIKRNVIPYDMKNILIVDFSLIGDMVMNIPFLKTIKHNCPSAKITMVCMPWAKVVLGDQELVDKFIVFDGKDKLSSPVKICKNFLKIRRILREINNTEFDIGFEPKGDLRHILFLHYTNCNRTVSYNYTGGEYLITDCFEPDESIRHLIDEKIMLLKKIGFNTEAMDDKPSLILSEEWQRYANDFKKQNKLDNFRIVGVHPGASNINKQYQHYPQLLNKICNSTIKFMIFEGNNESKIVDEICKSLHTDNYIRVHKSLKEYVSLISLCDYMICNDSAAGHIAAAYGIPEMVIFGPVLPETALPRGNADIRYVSKNTECKPCTLPVCPLKTNQCISQITVNEILNGMKN